MLYNASTFPAALMISVDGINNPKTSSKPKTENRRSETQTWLLTDETSDNRTPSHTPYHPVIYFKSLNYPPYTSLGYSYGQIPIFGAHNDSNWRINSVQPKPAAKTENWPLNNIAYLTNRMLTETVTRTVNRTTVWNNWLRGVFRCPTINTRASW